MSGHHRRRQAFALNKRWWTALKAAGRSQNDLARELGVAHTVLCDITGGTRKLSFNMAFAVEEALGEHGLALELLTLQLEEDVTTAKLERTRRELERVRSEQAS